MTRNHMVLLQYSYSCAESTYIESHQLDVQQ